MYVLVKVLFWIAVWPSLGKTLFGFCLYCLDCEAVALSASFPFGALKQKVLGNCIDSGSLRSFLSIQIFCVILS